MMMCSKLHCQKFFKLKSFSYKIPGSRFTRRELVFFLWYMSGGLFMSGLWCTFNSIKALSLCFWRNKLYCTNALLLLVPLEARNVTISKQIFFYKRRKKHVQ